MERDVTPSGRRRMWFAIGAGLLLALIAAVIVAVFVLLPRINGTEPENTAAYFPEHSVAYSWVSLSPGMGQGQRALDLWNRLERLPNVRDALDDLVDGLEDETQIDFEEEVLPWIGRDLSVAVLGGSFDPAEGSPSFVALIGVRDVAGASAFLSDLRGLLEDDGAELEREADIHDFEVWADRDSDFALALSADWFLIGSPVDALHDVLELMETGDQPSLADNARFQAARSAMRADRAASLYVDLDAVFDQLASLSGSGADALSELSGVGLNPDLDAGGLGAPAWLAVSIGFIDRGIAIEVVAPSETPFISGFTPGFSLVEDPARLLPDDTLFLGAGSFEPDIDVWRDELGNYTVADLDESGAFTDLFADPAENGAEEREIESDSTLAEVLDYGLELIDEAIGIHLEMEFFDHLGGQVAIAVREFDYERIDDFENYAVDVVAMLSYNPGGESGLMRTIDRFLSLLEDGLEDDFPTAAERDLGADHPAVVFDIEDLLGQTAYSPGYVFHSGQMTLGSTERALRAVVEAQDGSRLSLADAPEYRRARDALPDVVQGLIFLDLHRIIAGFTPESLGIDADYYEILSALGAVAVGVSTDAEHSRISIALTLFPE